MNNLQTEINEKVNTNNNKVKKEIDIARKAFPCFIFIFVGVVSVFSYHIYIVQPQQINNVQEIFEGKVNVLQNQIEQEVERKVNVLQSQIEQEVERKVNVLQSQIEQEVELHGQFKEEVERKKNVLQNQIEQEVERKVNILQNQIEQEVERKVNVLQNQIEQEVERKVNVLQNQIEQEVERKKNVLQSQIEQEVELHGQFKEEVERKKNVLQNQIEQEVELHGQFKEEVERKKNVLQNQIEQEDERKVNVLQNQIEQEVERKVNVLQNQIEQEVERKVNVLQSQIEQKVERKVNVIQSQFKEEVKKDWKNCESKIAVVESQLETKLDEFRRTLSYGSHTFTWKITGFEYILSQAREGYQTITRTDPFYIFGYKLKLIMIPYRQGDGAGTNISIFFVIKKGENDAILSWPFYKRVMFTLIDQQENPNDRKNIAMSFTGYPENKECFGRPVKDENTAHGFKIFVSHDKLRERRYIVEDTIFIQVELATPLF